MPVSEQECKANADKFYKYRYPNVIGAIDGTLIDIKVPDEHRIDYFTRKFTTSVNLTAVCDADKKFMNINVGYSGRCHDAHIFANSTLARLIHTSNAIPNNYHLLGDAAYALHINVMPPYGGDNLPNWKEMHNQAHSSTRMVIERSFSDLKNRWLRLNCLRNDFVYANDIIATCCCLQNICISYGDIEASEPQCEAMVGTHAIDCTDASSKRNSIAEHIFSA